MSKQSKVDRINGIINGPRGEFARQHGAEAYINDAGLLRYRDRAKGYARKISFRELLRYLHGEDIQALMRAA